MPCRRRVRLVDDGDRAWLMGHLRRVAVENLQDDLDQLFSRLDSDRDGKVTALCYSRQPAAHTDSECTQADRCALCGYTCGVTRIDRLD